MPLLVVLAPGTDLSDDLLKNIRRAIRGQVSPARPRRDHRRAGGAGDDHRQELEVPIKRLLRGVPESTAINRATVANPEVVDWYVAFAGGRGPR